MADPDFSDQLVAYIDLLGFRDAVRETPSLENILQVVRGISEIRGDFFAESKKTETGSQAFSRPAITIFSDNIVISYPLEKLKEHDIDIHTACFFLMNLIGFIAWNALSAGLLIRGGITIGKLYHANGIVIGHGLIEAYEIESQVSVSPRVVLSKELADQEEIKKFSFGYVDQDGLRCLDYMIPLITRSAAGGAQFNPDVKPWVEYVEQLILKNLEKFKATGDLRRLSKWASFSDRFNKTKTSTNPAILAMTKKS